MNDFENVDQEEILKPVKTCSPRLDLDYDQIKKKYLDQNSPER